MLAIYIFKETEKMKSTITFKMTTEEFKSRSNDYEGGCLKCGFEAYGVEPDARNYECEECGHAAVFGLEELLLMGRIEILEDEDAA